MASSITQTGMVRKEVFMHDARLWVGQPIIHGGSPLDPCRDIYARGMVAAMQGLWRESDGY